MTREYTTVDKSTWMRGEWDREPDKVQWKDKATGLPCLIVRSPVGALCGYVGVPEGHPYYGKGYEEVDVEVHGGITFASPCDPNATEEEGVCHIPDPGESDKVWWLGFDCAHAWDVSVLTMPDVVERMMKVNEAYADIMPRSVYRNIEYVKAECANLARQCRDAGIHASRR